MSENGRKSGSSDFVALSELTDAVGVETYEQRKEREAEHARFQEHRYAAARYYQLRMVIFGLCDLPALVILAIHSFFFTTVVSASMLVFLFVAAWKSHAESCFAFLVLAVINICKDVYICVVHARTPLQIAGVSVDLLLTPLLMYMTYWFRSILYQVQH